MNIFVISMKKSKSRRVLIKKEMANLNIPFVFFNAVDGESMSPNLQKKMTKLRFDAYKNSDDLQNKSKVLPGEVGCALSHIKIYSHIVKKKKPNRVLFDVDLHTLLALKCSLTSNHSQS